MGFHYYVKLIDVKNGPHEASMLAALIPGGH